MSNTLELTPTTEQVLQAMLTENTGRHFLDSGGIYGRHWEANQGRDFENEPATLLKFTQVTEDNFWMDVTHNLYHWLRDRLDYDAKMQAQWEAFVEETDPEGDKPWSVNLEEWFERLKETGEVHTTPIYNTYNGEDMLSQVIQYALFEYNDVEYVWLQIHNGCDVRGGYTAPKIFRTNNDYSLYDNACATIACEGAPEDTEPQIPGLEIPQEKVTHFWDTYNGGYSWEPEGDYTKLNDYPASAFRIDAAGNGYCPICGGRLRAWAT